MIQIIDFNELEKGDQFLVDNDGQLQIHTAKEIFPGQLLVVTEESYPMDIAPEHPSEIIKVGDKENPLTSVAMPKLKS